MASKKKAGSKRGGSKKPPANSNGSSKNGKGEQIDRELPCKLTDAERIERGELMAACVPVIEELKNERKELNAQIKAKQEERDGYAESVRTGIGNKRVRCRWEESLRENVKRLVRTDTDEVVEEVALTADDRNESLFDEDDADDEDTQLNA